MALKLNDKQSILNQIIPEVTINVAATGITVLANERLSMPRFIPYDVAGCKDCVDCDGVFSKEGVTIFCSRIKGRRFVPFDRVFELPGHCFFKIRNKGRVYMIEHGQSPPKCEQKPVIEKFVPRPPQKPKTENEATKVKNAKEDGTPREFLDKLSAAVAPLEFAQSAMAKPKEQSGHKEFMDKLGVAVAPLEFAHSAAPKVKVQKEESAHKEFMDKLGVAVAPLEFAHSTAAKVKVQKEEDRHKEFMDKLGVAVAPLEFAQSATVKGKAAKQKPAEGSVHKEFLDKLGVAVAPLAFAQSAPVKVKEEEKPEQPSSSDDGRVLQEFFDSLKAATAGIPSQAETLRQLKRNSETAQREEQQAIAALDQEMKNKKKKTKDSQ